MGGTEGAMVGREGGSDDVRQGRARENRRWEGQREGRREGREGRVREQGDGGRGKKGREGEKGEG